MCVFIFEYNVTYIINQYIYIEIIYTNIQAIGDYLLPWCACDWASSSLASMVSSSKPWVKPTGENEATCPVSLQIAGYCSRRSTRYIYISLSYYIYLNIYIYMYIKKNKYIYIYIHIYMYIYISLSMFISSLVNK